MENRAHRSMCISANGFLDDRFITTDRSWRRCNQIAVLIALVVVAKGHVASAGDAECSPSSHVSDNVSLEFMIGRDRVSIDDRLNFDFLIVNNGNRDVYIFKNLAVGDDYGISIHIASSSGEKVASPASFDGLQPLPADNNNTSMLLDVGPGRLYGARWSLPVNTLLRKPGRYKVHIEYKTNYRCTQFGSEFHKLPVWWADAPVLISEEKTIDVTPSQKSPASH